MTGASRTAVKSRCFWKKPVDITTDDVLPEFLFARGD
jgi:hypothetical protein